MKRQITTLILIAAAGLLAAAFAVNALFQASASRERVKNLFAKTPLVTRYVNQYNSPQQFMEGIYAADKAPAAKSGGAVRAVIVPHHLVAAADMAAGLRALAGQAISNIILLSPDHFGRCSAPLCTTNAVYETFFGRAPASPELVGRLKQSPLVADDPDLFKNEHGIYAVAPFIAKYRGDIPVTPVAVSLKNWPANKEAMLELFNVEAKAGTVFVVSSDFSHYLSLEEADRMDALTQKVLTEGDLRAVAGLKNPAQSDCPACLWLAAALAKQNNFYDPEFVMHTNSATILGDPQAKETTSHFTIVWRQK